MRKVLLVGVLVFGTLLTAFGQTQEITGTITSSEDGKPIPGASVTVQGTTIGAASDVDGKYTLKVPADVTQLKYSSVSMKAQIIEIGGRSVIDVVLEPDYLGLEEVVVVAYGTTTKASYTGAASVVKSDKLSKNPTTSVVKALQANASGVQVVSTSGASDAEPTIRIRGIGSITADANPLWVVDGIVGAQRPHVNDIETVTVLKDAAASSLYGSRAANGVIVVTTKKGSTSGKTKFTYIGKRSYQNLATNNFEMLEADEFYKKSWEGIYNYASRQIADDPTWAATQGVSGAADYAHQNIESLAGRNPFSIDNPIDDNGEIKPGAELMINNSWFDMSHETGIIDEHTLTASGGNEGTQFYFSGTYYNQQAITVPDKIERLMGFMSVESKVNDRVKVGFNSRMSYNWGNTVKNITNGSGTGYAAYTYPNNVPLYQLDDNFEQVIGPDGNPEWNWDNLVSKDYNPIAQNTLDPRAQRESRLFTSAFLNWEFIDGLVFDTKISGQLYNRNTDYFRNPYHGDAKAYGGSSDKYSREDRRYLSSTTLTYDKDLAEQHNINILAGYEFEKFMSKDITAAGKGYDVPFSDELDIAAEMFEIGSSTLETSLISYFSRLNYTFADKYYLSGSYRRDGSSRFGPDSRWADFWSVSGSWRLKQEAFLTDFAWLDDLKLRVSYGTNGNESVPAYAYYPTYGINYNYDYNIGMLHTQLANYELRWEKNKIFNVGMEFTVFNFLRGNIEYFDRVTDDLLMNKPLPLSVGFDSRLENVGGLSNKGFEIELTSTNMSGGDLVWLTDFNLSHYKNEITALSQEEIITGNNKRWIVGNSMYTWYMREYAGVDPNTGAAMWYVTDEVSGEKITTTEYNDADRYELGESLPKFYGGLNNTFTYKENLTFNFQFYLSLGGKVYNSLMQTTMNDGHRYGHQLNKKVLESWQEPGDETDVPIFLYNNSSLSNNASSRFLEDASFLRLRNVNISYTLPRHWYQQFGVDDLSVFVNGDNLFVLTKYEGHDPEQGVDGVTNTTRVPNVRTITFGVSLGF